MPVALCALQEQRGERQTERERERQRERETEREREREKKKLILHIEESFGSREGVSVEVKV